MSAPSLARRGWDSFTGRPRAGRVRTVGRARRGYTLWQRLWASFIGVDLPPACVGPREARGAAPARPALVPDAHWADRVIRAEGTGRVEVVAASGAQAGAGTVSGRSGDGWFALPALGQAFGLTAAGGDAVLLEAPSPDGAAAFLLRAEQSAQPEYRLEVVVHGAETARPLMACLRYPVAGGGEHTLLVPVAAARFGPAASLVRLPGFDPVPASARWSARGPEPVTPALSWDAATVAVSVRAALNEATRQAWRAVREQAGDELRAAIDGGLS
ncbi:hypothetical protein [Streptomyces sp. NPDC048106]|uniref:hypothetical protein n=1 Tax=Streptomyces sp. NPDC048106 TaxID=3155750 RepID=UPI00345337D2